MDAVCREGPARVLELVELGAEFTRGSSGQLHLTRGTTTINDVIIVYLRLSVIIIHGFKKELI